MLFRINTDSERAFQIHIGMYVNVCDITAVGSFQQTLKMLTMSLGFIFEYVGLGGKQCLNQFQIYVIVLFTSMW